MPIPRQICTATTQRIRPTFGSSRSTLPPLAAPSSLRMVNYYPIASAQARIWTDGHVPYTMAADFAKLAALGANAVRITIWPAVFGYPTPQSAQLFRLKRLVDLAAANGLYTYITLFAGFSAFSDSAGSAGFAQAVLLPFFGDTRICAIELFNELDTTNASARTWAQAVVPAVKAATTAPVTVSISNTLGNGGLTTLKGLGLNLGFYNLHYYNAAEQAYGQLATAQANVAPVPLYIGETGSYTGLDIRNTDSRGKTWWEYFQALYIRTVTYHASLLGLPKPAIWAANDLLESPDAYSPHDTNLADYSYGLFAVDGSRKQAADVLQANWISGATDLSFNGGFEVVDTASGLPAGWSTVSLPSGAVFDTDAVVMHSGGRALRLANTANSGATTPGVKIIYPGPITPTVSYTLTYWMRNLLKTSGATVRAQLSWFTATGSFISSSSGTNPTSGFHDWTQYSIVAAAPASAAYVEIHCNSGLDSSTSWFDDVSFAPT